MEITANGNLVCASPRLAAQDADFHATVRPFFVRDPFQVPAAARIVGAVDGGGAGGHADVAARASAGRAPILPARRARAWG